MEREQAFTRLTNRVAVHQSAYWHTNSGLVRTAEGYILVDPGILKAELDAIAAFSAGVGVRAGLVTHAHWDHMLWSARFGREVARFASEGAVTQIQAERYRFLQEMAEFERVNGLGESQWDHPLLFQEQPLSSGSHFIGGLEVQVVPLPGHSAGQCGFYFAGEGVLFCGDTLSDEEVPTLSVGPQDLAHYQQSLDFLAGLAARARWIVPGHGQLANPAEALRRLDSDHAYLEKLSKLGPADLEGDLNALGARILEELAEKRADSEAGWLMHLQNLALLKRVLIGRAGG